MPVSPPLCQPGGGASCGACCGLYNFRHHSRAAVAARLARHTDALERLAREPAAWREATVRLARQERAEVPLFPAVRVCALLGFLDAAHTRVGCLGHPSRGGGVDLRDCGAYRASVCEEFSCPSSVWLSDAQAQLVRRACPDWYLYGLVVTDVDFVRGCLALLEWRLARALSPLALLAHPAALGATRRLLALKESAPGREADAALYGRFAPDAQGEPVLRTLDYRALGTPPAPEDDVVLCLGYAPATAGALEAARTLVRGHVEAVAAALEAPAQPG